jgi:hypothetical protein
MVDYSTEHIWSVPTVVHPSSAVAKRPCVDREILTQVEDVVGVASLVRASIDDLAAVPAPRNT